MKLRLLDAAELELDDAISWYRARDEGLADRFVAEIMAARDKIIAHHP